MRTRTKIILGGTVTVLLCVAVQTWLVVRAKVSEHLTRQGLVSVNVGMTGGEVVSRIGYPLKVVPRGAVHMAPLGKPLEKWPDGYVWVYASPGPPPAEGLAVYVLMKDGQVEHVTVKHDDFVIYSRPAGPVRTTGPRLQDVLN